MSAGVADGATGPPPPRSHQLAVAVGLEVGRVVLDERGHRRAQRVDHGGRRGRIPERDEAGQALRVDRVVGRGGADLGEPRGLGGAGELADVLAVVEAEHHAPVAPEHPAQDGGDLAGHALPGLRVRRGHGRGAERPPRPRGVAKALLGPRHQVDRREVRVLERRAPRAEPVLLEDDRPRLRPRPDGRPDLPRQPEAGTPVGHPHGLLAEQVLDHLAAALGVGQADDRVRVGVNHRLRVEEAVEERLDRRPGRARLLEAAREVVDHLLVAHVVALEEREHLGEAHAGKVPARHALEVRPAALDPQDPDRPAEEVGLGELDRRVSPAPDRERRLGADPARDLHELVDEIEPAHGLVLVAALHGSWGGGPYPSLAPGRAQPGRRAAGVAAGAPEGILIRRGASSGPPAEP